MSTLGLGKMCWYLYRQSPSDVWKIDRPSIKNTVRSLYIIRLKSKYISTFSILVSLIDENKLSPEKNLYAKITEHLGSSQNKFFKIFFCRLLKKTWISNLSRMNLLTNESHKTWKRMNRSLI